MEQNFHENIIKLTKEKPLYQFDRFFIRKMLQQDEISDMEEARIEAWHIFWKRIGKQPLATIPTMKRWFGIGGVAIPSRYMVYQICFALGENSDSLREYLRKGIMEPDISWNDYQEMIMVYGLDHQYDYEKCVRLIDQFEKNLNRKEKVMHTFSTKQLMDGYYKNRSMDEEDFFLWMLDHAAFFKGYSKTAVSYFKMLKDEICDYMKKDAKEQLRMLLEETDYAAWAAKNQLPKEAESKKVERFIKRCRRKKQDRIPEEAIAQIQTAARTAFNEKNTNAMLLSEIWFNEKNGAHPVEESQGLYNMTARHLSELLRIAEKREEEIWLAAMTGELEELAEDETCEKNLLEDLNAHKILCEKHTTVKEVKAQLYELRKNRKRRYFCIQRSDLLPMILYISQRRYLESQAQSVHYEKKEAKAQYIKMANSILNACQMALLDDSYRLDAACLVCFEQEDMHEYQEVLEIIYGGRDQDEME